MIASLIAVVIILIQWPFLNYFTPEFLKYECLIIDVVCIFNGMVILKNFLHPYIIFLGTINLFLCSRIWLEDYINYPFYYTTFFSQYPFSVDIQREMLFMLIVSFVGLNFGMSFVRKNEGICLNIKKTDVTVEKWTERLIILLIPLLIYQFYQTWLFVSQYGYIGLYLEQSGVSREKSIINYIPVIFEGIFFAFLASRPKKNKVLKYTIIVFIIMSISLLNGGRGAVAAILLTFLTYYNLYCNRINWKIIISGLLGFILLFQVVGVSRSLGNNDELSINATMTELVVDFFSQQGVSITVLGYAVQIDDGSFIDVLYPLVSMVQKPLDSEYTTKNIINYEFSHKISNAINPLFYAKGAGTGSSYIAEVYSCGGFLLLLLVNILLGWFIIYSLKICKNNFWWTFAIIIFWDKLYIMPRGALLAFFPILIKWLLILLFIRVIYKNLYICNNQ